MKCFYHKSDFDGKCSAAIIKYFYPKTVLFPFEYDMKFPWDEIDKNDNIYMFDISLSDDEMYKLNNYCYNLVYIDHHKSKIKSLNLFKFNGSFNTNKAACIQVWEYFSNNIPIPYAVQLIGRYDIWDLDENVLNFQNGLYLYNTDPNNLLFWSDLFTSNHIIDNIIKKGSIIRDYKKFSNIELIKNFSFKTKFRNYDVIAINIIKGSSLIFESHEDYENADILLTFGWNGSKWKISMYTTKNNIDVSEICKEFGGGGHKQAAGFHCDSLPDELKLFGAK